MARAVRQSLVLVLDTVPFGRETKGRKRITFFAWENGLKNGVGLKKLLNIEIGIPMSPESPGGNIIQNSITVSTTVQSKDGQHQNYKGKIYNDLRWW